MGCPQAPLLVDHLNLDGLDNRKQNLRVVTASHNAQNRRRIKGTSIYKGVFPDGRKWRAAVTQNYRKHALGTFDTDIEAARAYDAKVLELFGPLAFLNFPNDSRSN